MKKLLLLTLLCFMFMGTTTIQSQVMWNLKGGWMTRKLLMDEYQSTTGTNSIEERTRPEWTAGMELEIPLSTKLNIETGLRYRNHHVLVKNTYDYKSFIREEWDEASTIFEIPLRLTYKQPLGRHFSIHAGVGPYVSAIADGWSSKRAHETKWSDFVHVGLEPSVAINWACFSLGATYNIPCFYKGYKDENKPVVMATLGIRFKSHVWKYVGATLLTIASVGAAASYAWSAANSGSYSSSSYSSGSSSYSSSSSGGNYEEMYRHWERRAQAAYNSLSGHSGSSSTYQNNMRLLREAQSEMRKYREKARKAGITIYQSDWETKTVRIY